jgi:phosphocarrier protein HPr
VIIERKIVIKNASGLHARPAAIFVQIANKYDCDISVKKGNQKINGKSIMGIMMLAAEMGSKIMIVAEGDDAEQAVEELERLLLSDSLENFDEKKEKKK